MREHANESSATVLAKNSATRTRRGTDEQPLLDADGEAGVAGDEDLGPDIVRLTLKEAYEDFWMRSGNLIIAKASFAVSTFWGMELISSLGKDYSAAETPINSIRLIALNAAMIPLAASNITISKKIDDAEEQGNIVNAILASYVYALIVGGSTMAALHGVGHVLEQTGQSKEDVIIADEFYSTFANCMIPAVYMAAHYQILAAMKTTWPVNVAYVIGNAATIFFAHGYIKGRFDLQQQGVKGFGSSMMVGFISTAALLAVYLLYQLCRHPNYLKKLSLKKIGKELALHIGYGVLLDIIAGIEFGALFVGAMLINSKLDKRQTSLYNIATEYAIFSFTVQHCFRTAITSIVGNIRGQRNDKLRPLDLQPYQLDAIASSVRNDLNKTIFSGVSSSFILSVIQLIVFVAAAAPIARSFEPECDEDFIVSLRKLLAIFCAGQVFDHARNIYGAALYGNENFLAPSAISLLFILGISLGGTVLALNNGADLHTVMAINAASLCLATISVAAIWHTKETNKMCDVETVQRTLHETERLQSAKQARLTTSQSLSKFGTFNGGSQSQPVPQSQSSIHSVNGGSTNNGDLLSGRRPPSPR